MVMPPQIELGESRPATPSASLGHVVVLTNFLAPHEVPVLFELSRHCGKLTVLLSTPMEQDRDWTPDWGPLDVRVQYTWTFRRPRRHPLGFPDLVSIHVPWNTSRLLRQIRPDVIVSSELGFRSLFSAIYRMFSPRTALVLCAGLSQHTELGRGWPRQLLRKWLVRRADGVTANGRNGMQYLRRIGVPAEKLACYPYAAVPEALYRGPVQRDPQLAHRLLYVGRLIELKGLLPFMQVLATWGSNHPDRQVEFQLVGDGPMRSELESLAMPANVSVQFLGARHFAEIAEIYGQGGIFVLPTLSDEWGLVVNEAMAAGLPVLGSLYSQAVEELCSEGETGWTFHPDKPGEIADALDRALSTSHERLQAMRVAARARVESITPAYAAQCLVEVIRAAVERCGTR
jgi:glycosyltransferase involved in cell wall biosynthesis